MSAVPELSGVNMISLRISECRYRVGLAAGATNENAPSFRDDLQFCLKRTCAFRRLRLDQSHYFVALGHRARPDLRAAQRRASIRKQSHALKVPTLQQTKRQTTHKRVARARSVYHLHFQCRNV